MYAFISIKRGWFYVIDLQRLLEALPQVDLGKTYLQVQEPEDCFASLEKEKDKIQLVLIYILWILYQ